MQYFDDSLLDRTFVEIAAWLRSVVDEAEPRLRSIAEDVAGEGRGQGKWTRKEVLGHLVDSAANNHPRFVRAQIEPVFRGPGYAHEHWVEAQGYRVIPWDEIVDLWCGYNRHLSRVIARIPESLRDVPCEIGDGDPLPLSYVALDYVGHAEHHLEQVVG